MTTWMPTWCNAMYQRAVEEEADIVVADYWDGISKTDRVVRRLGITQYGREQGERIDLRERSKSFTME